MRCRFILSRNAAVDYSLRVTATPLPYGLSGREQAQRYFDWIVGLFGAALSGHVLDHGAGTGALSARLSERCERVVALEPELRLFEQLQERFRAQPGVSCMHGTIETYLARAGAGSLDAVLSSNVLEHLPNDVDCMRLIRESLRPGGAFAVYVPARAELFGTLDESVGHLRRYSRGLLRERLEQAGFFVQWVRYANLAGALPWWVTGRVLKRPSIPGSRLGLFDRLVLPISTRIEALCPVPYGLNVAALARRL
ncbi:MAG TPA: class I SAM-dependent methyltransferase [Polyangiaceae bacterium]